MTQSKISIVDSPISWGVLLWKLPNGKVLGNGSGEVLSMPARKGDLAAVKRMQEAAAYYGYPEGKTVFMPGGIKLTQSEWEDQMDAFMSGKADPWSTDHLAPNAGEEEFHV